ncbi:LOW QUALITY PROTEIN: hypothetical protein HID58_062211, partial [Brassica napus]
SVRPHYKKTVNDFAIHPSGKLALAVYLLCDVESCEGKRSFCCRFRAWRVLLSLIRVGRVFFMGVGVHQSEDAKLLLELENGSHKRILCSSPRDVSNCFRVKLLFCFSLILNLGKAHHSLRPQETSSLDHFVTGNGDAFGSLAKIVCLICNKSGTMFTAGSTVKVHQRSVVGCFCIIVWDMGMAPKENAYPMRKAHIGNQKAQKLEEVPNSGRALLLID